MGLACCMLPRAYGLSSRAGLHLPFHTDRFPIMDDPALPPRALLNCYFSEMEKYCLKNNILFKILVIIDNVPGLSPFIGVLHPNIKVVFLPPDITSLIQHMHRELQQLLRPTT